LLVNDPSIHLPGVYIKEKCLNDFSSYLLDLFISIFLDI